MRVNTVKEAQFNALPMPAEEDIEEYEDDEEETLHYAVELYREVTYTQRVTVFVTATDEEEAQDAAHDLASRGGLDWEDDQSPDDYGDVYVDEVYED